MAQKQTKEIGCRSTSSHELLLSTSRLSRNNSANEIANKIQCIEGTKNVTNYWTQILGGGWNGTLHKMEMSKWSKWDRDLHHLQQQLDWANSLYLKLGWVFSMCKLVQVVWRIYKEISVFFACSGETFPHPTFVLLMWNFYPHGMV